MGRVKELWQEDRDKKARARIQQLIEDGYTEKEAYEMAFAEQEEEDEANGQFGLGA